MMLQHAENPGLYSFVDRLNQYCLKVIHRQLCQLAAHESGDRVLDIKCCSDSLLRSLGAMTSCELCGMDPDFNHSRKLRASFLEANILFAQPEDIPWHDAAFDLVVSSYPLAMEDSTVAVFGEIYRVLKNGGQLLLPCISHHLPLVSSLCSLMNPDDVRYSNRLSKSDIMNKLILCGYEDVQWHSFGFAGGVVSAWKTAEHGRSKQTTAFVEIDLNGGDNR